MTNKTRARVFLNLKKSILDRRDTPQKPSFWGKTLSL